MKEDIEFLKWIYYRMENVHGENIHYDYMIKFKKIIDKYPELIKEKNISTNLKLLNKV